jgi:uncharacterized membrane protein
VSGLNLLETCLYPPHLRRTGSIALVVGTWLTLFNQGDVIWTGQMGGWIWIKIALNYLTPFAVANLGLLSKRREKSSLNGSEK